jgi:hypothetical protein
MILLMASRIGIVAWLLLAACGGSSTQSDSSEPQTARQKQYAEAKANGELDAPTTKWGGWRYQGDREDCRYVIGRKCFKTEKAACASCKDPAACTSVGGGPATVSCNATASK